MTKTLKIRINAEPAEGIKSFRIMKSHFNIVVLAFMIVVVAMLGGCKKSTSEQQGGTVKTDETLRFVFLADSRGDSLAHPVNDTVLTAIINQIAALSPRPSFVIFGGDMSYRGWIHGSFTFLAWKSLFDTLIHQGITLYTAMGNHELYHEHADSGFKLANQQYFQSVFPENPSNGPAGYDHLAYSFASQGGNSFFAVLDPYYLTGNIIPSDLGGNIDSAQMSWLKAQVAQTAATHKFLFIHTPYYYISNDSAEASAANESYTKLWAFLDSTGFDFYACGHSHLFSRRTIDSTVLANPQTTPPTPKWRNNVVQLLNGAAGAGPSTDTIDANIRASWNVHNDPKTYYFSVVDISGGTVTVNSYSGYHGAYSIFDTFTVTK